MDQLKQTKLFRFGDKKTDWVIFDNGRPKIKLRKYVSELAQELSGINRLTKVQNRDNLILNFEVYGMPGIKKYFQEEIKANIKKAG